MAIASGTKTRSAGEITGWISLAASVCAIIISLLLLRQYRTKDCRLATQAVSGADNVLPPFWSDGSRQGAILSANGVESLAIMFSLPYVCLMWGSVARI